MLCATASPQSPVSFAHATAHHVPSAPTLSKGSGERIGIGTSGRRVPSGLNSRATHLPPDPPNPASTMSFCTGSHERSAPWSACWRSWLVVVHDAPASWVTANVGWSRPWPVMRYASFSVGATIHMRSVAPATTIRWHVHFAPRSAGALVHAAVSPAYGQSNVTYARPSG